MRIPWNKGRPWTLKEKQRLSIAQKGKHFRAKQRVVLICRTCGTRFAAYPFEEERRKYCSMKCRNIGYIGHKNSPESIRKQSLALKGKKKSPEHIANVVSARRRWMESPAGKRYLRELSIKRVGGGNPMYGKHGPTREEHWNWQGGISRLRHAIRQSTPYKRWRKAVFARDHYRCLICGRTGGTINAHHIKPFSYLLKQYGIKTLDDAVRCVALWVVDNGITMCSECHLSGKEKAPLFFDRS